MRRFSFEPIRRLQYAATWQGVWWRIRYWWSLQDKSPLVILGIMFIVPSTIGLIIYQTIESNRIHRELRCLTLNIYHEARGEPEQGQYAVAEVTMNRVESKRFPDTVCEVVYEKRWDRLRKRYVGAFSWTEIESRSKINLTTIEYAWQIAETVYHGRHTPAVEDALFFHARHIKPSWARKKSPVTRIGRHIFYR